MIEKITVVDAQYSGLEQSFPAGHELRTDSGLVLLVGPNAVGKTAFLRMLATSLNYERFFREKGISMRSELMRFTEQSPPAEATLRERTDENIWRYLKPQIDGPPLYYQFVATGVHFNNNALVNSGIRDYVAFIPIPDLRKDPDPSKFEEGLTEGQCQRRRNGIVFADVDRFFQEHVNPKWAPPRENYALLGVNTYEEMRVLERRGHLFPETPPLAEAVSENSHLVVLLDEPTAFLDPRGNVEFRRKVQEALRTYSGKLQMFVATNDCSLIGTMPGCLYIDMYQRPAQSSREVSLE